MNGEQCTFPSVSECLLKLQTSHFAGGATNRVSSIHFGQQ